MKVIKEIIYRFTSGLLLLGGIMLVAGCRNEDLADDPSDSDAVVFTAGIVGPEALATRANNDVYPITTKYYPCDFYVKVAGENYQDEYRQNASSYVIPSGYEGSIIPKDDTKRLNWFSRTKPHDFWAWTMPHEVDYDPQQALESDRIPITFRNTTLDDTKNGSTGTWLEDSWKNGKALEQLLGAHAGPYVYNEFGMYVPLRFRHLVPKVILKKFYVVDNVGGTTNENLKGTITFYGMPSQATLYTSPRNEETGEAMAPYVAVDPDWDYDPAASVTYAICNSGLSLMWEGYEPYYYASTMPRDCWYLPPDVDFSKMTFKIELYEYVNGAWELSQTHGKHGAYYGDFSKISFSRSTNGSGYDDTKDPGSDKTILHAGEYLELTINLYEKGNPTVHGVITAWATDGNDREGNAYVHQGLYSVDQMRDLSNVMNTKDPDLKEYYYQLYGSGKTTADDPEGEYPDYEDIYGHEMKIFELFDDIGLEDATSSSSNSKVFSLYMNDDYILDGRGHTINVTSQYVYTANIRDVYLRYYAYSTNTNPRVYTEYVVYIDKMGEVWKVDPLTYEMEDTGLNCLQPEYRYFTLWIWNPPSMDLSKYGRYDYEG